LLSRILLAGHDGTSLVMPVLRKLRQEDGEFEDSLDYIVRSCLKKKPSKQSNPKEFCPNPNSSQYNYSKHNNDTPSPDMSMS
jgi:hypothetical protein